MVDLIRKFDVLVIGGGNAALCAAISARRAGASVLVLEGAPKFYRGGNTRHTRNMRCAHDAATDILTGPYTEEEFWDDLLRVTGGQTDEELARFMIRESKEILDWIVEQGVRFQPSLGGTLSLGRTNSFFLGGGRAMLNALYLHRRAARRRDRSTTRRWSISGSRTACSCSATVKQRRPARSPCAPSTLVAAAGGFEANIEWLKEYWGEAADNFLIRGTPYNRGSMLKMLLDNGVQEVGDPTQCHAVAIDARAPKFDGGIITRLDCVVFGIVVNKHAAALLRRGRGHLAEALRDLGPAGRSPARPDRLHHLRRHRRWNCSCRRCSRRSQAQTIAELAGKLELDPAALEKTVAEFNAAVRPGTFDHTILDDCRTEGLTPPKSALGAARSRRRLIYAYPVRPGITFTYLGTRVNRQARMLMKDGKPSANMFAAGEIMAGNVLGKGYAAGIGMTIGSVFGRIAGREAATTCTATRHSRGGRPADDGLQLLPLLRGAVRGISRRWRCAARFSDGDLNYLANLCHACGACYVDCQFSPPHEFDVNVPQTLAHRARRILRRLCLAARALRGMFARNGLAISLIAALSVAAFIFGFAAVQRPRRCCSASTPAPGAFYRLMPHNAMAALFGAAFSLCHRGDGHGRARVLARYRRAGRHADRREIAVAGDHGRRRAALSRRRRRRLLQRGRAPERPAQALSSPHLLRIPAVLRLDLRGDALSLPARRARRRIRGGTCRSCSARSAASAF